MFGVLQNALKTPDLKRKILYTIFILFIFRLGNAITVPFVETSGLLAQMKESGNSFFSYWNMMSGGAFDKASIFALSITPYINASIIIQLLTVAIPSLERLAKEGAEGRKTLNKITRWTTVVIAIIQALGYFFLLRNYDALLSDYQKGAMQWFAAIVIIVTFTAGAALIMWLGEQINDKGIGNGISIILFAGIIARGPAAINILVENWKLGGLNYLWVPLTVIVFAFA